MIYRIIKDEIETTKKSVLLLGPRQVGKSTLINSLKPDLEINLADELEFLNYSSRPELFRQTVEAQDYKVIYIDEIQRLPKLLNTIQAIVDKNKKIKFYLTGSSARKLKRGEANLLPGRLLSFYLGPLIAKEINYNFNTQKALSFGSLPEPYLLDNDKEIKLLLRSYAGNYLKEEIKAESLVRNIDSFARFFNSVVSNVAEFVDYTKLANRSKISRHSIPRYFEILEDTLIGYRINSYDITSDQFELVKHPKFYFFDNGVYNGLLGNYVASSYRMGKLSEQLIFNQIMHSAWASNLDCKISTFRTRTGLEVDFIVELEQKTYAIEVKTTDQIDHRELSGLDFFNHAVNKPKQCFVFHLGTKEVKFKQTWSLPWQKGLKEIGL